MSITERRTFGRSGLQISPLGFGSYRVDLAHPEHGQALREALVSGCNLIDTSTNYGDGEAESLIGEVLQELFIPASPTTPPRLTRDQVVIVTKAGYVQGRNLELARLRIEQGHPFEGMVKFAADCWHCISPSFLENQLTQSLDRLRLERVDFLLLHNPEYFLLNGGTHAEYYDRIEHAFAHLETEVARGRIRGYGVSSNTFPERKDSPDFTSLEILLERAARVSRDNHFMAVQCPFNLFEPGAALERNNSGKTFLEAAAAANLGVLVNRPLNAFRGSELVRLADAAENAGAGNPEEETAIETFRAALNELMQMESAYSFEEIVPTRDIAWGHLLHSNLERLSSMESWNSVRERQILPRRERALERLASSPEAAAWAEEYRFRSDEAFAAFSNLLLARQSALAARISRFLEKSCPELSTSTTLARRVLRLYRAVPGIHGILLGMRTPGWVRDALNDPAAETGKAPDSANVLAALGSAHELD